MALLTVESLCLGYNGVPVVKDVSFSLLGGEYVCIIGDNGAGKSTLLKTLLGLTKPLGGNIILGQSINRSDIGYLPQAREVQKDFPASVFEIVLSGCLNKSGLRPFYTKKQRLLAAKCLQQLGISSLTSRCFRELSGGQQQRVLLARALCASGKIIVLDEPAAGLDPEAAQDMYDAICALNHETKTTIIMVSHDIEAAKKYSSHILKISNGQAIMQENSIRITKEEI